MINQLKLEDFLIKYFNGLKVPKLTEDEAVILAEEIASGVLALEQNPNIDWLNFVIAMHEMEEED